MKKVLPTGFAILLIAMVIGVTHAAESSPVRQVSKADLNKREIERQKIGRKRPGSIMIAKDGRAVAMFQNRIEWIQLPPGVAFQSDTGQLKGNQGVVRAIDIEPQKIMWLDRTYNVQAAGNHILVCGTFCGILSITGDIVFKFPVTSSPPDRVLGILGINGDGTYAEVYIGKLEAGEDGVSPGQPREVLAWRYPDTLTRFPGPWKNGKPKEHPAIAFDQLLQGFRVRERQR